RPGPWRRRRVFQGSHRSSTAGKELRISSRDTPRVHPESNRDAAGQDSDFPAARTVRGYENVLANGRVEDPRGGTARLGRIEQKRVRPWEIFADRWRRKPPRTTAGSKKQRDSARGRFQNRRVWLAPRQRSRTRPMVRDWWPHS